MDLDVRVHVGADRLAVEPDRLRRVLDQLYAGVDGVGPVSGLVEEWRQVPNRGEPGSSGRLDAGE